MNILVKGGLVYDPRNKMDGEKKDIFIEDGTIVDETRPEITIDATDKIVMPGGIDLHSHIATYGLNMARFKFGFPTLDVIGHEYAKMGYTHVNEPLMTLNTASYVHHELSSIPILDNSAFLALDLRDIAKYIKSANIEKISHAVSFLLDETKAIAAYVYHPWVKPPDRKGSIFHPSVDFEDVIRSFSKLNEPIFIRSTSEMLERSFDVLSNFSLTHVAPAIKSDEQYEKVLESSSETKMDLGLVYSGENLQIKPEEPSVDYISVDIGLQTPVYFFLTKYDETEIHYASRLVSEADLLSPNLSFSTDSPSGASFLDYPKIFSGLTEEHSIYEFANITRNAPANVLGLRSKGHLGNGADADVAIYGNGNLWESEHLIKDGELIVKNFEIISKGMDTKHTYYKASEGGEDVKGDVYKMSTFRSEHLRVDKAFTSREKCI